MTEDTKLNEEILWIKSDPQWASAPAVVLLDLDDTCVFSAPCYNDNWKHLGCEGNHVEAPMLHNSVGKYFIHERPVFQTCFARGTSNRTWW